MNPTTTPEALAALVERWQGTTVLVLGDALLDEWQYGEPDRLSREAPVPVLAVGRTERAPGGAANTAVNLAALGARPVLIAPVGDDPEGTVLGEHLAAAGVEFHPIVVPGWQTPAKRRVVAARAGTGARLRARPLHVRGHRADLVPRRRHAGR